MLQRLRSLVPDRVASLVSNCGGTNRATSRFAGHLLDPELTEARFAAICHSLIFENGVRKTTQRGRNTALVQSAIDEGLLPQATKLRVLDIGASAGLDALATLDLLAASRDVEEYVLGDLYTHILLDRERGLVFDEDHKLVQVRRRFSFVATNFSYNHRFQRITNLPKRVRPWLLSRRHAFDASRALVRIPLVDRRVSLDPGSRFKLKRMDVFAPIEGTYDLIICMHLLVPRYFPQARIENGIANLSRALAIGGALLVGANERYRIVRRTGQGSFVAVERP